VARAQNGDGILAGSSDSQGTGEGIYLVRLAGATSLDILSRR